MPQVFGSDFWKPNTKKGAFIVNNDSTLKMSNGKRSMEPAFKHAMPREA